MQPSHVHEDHIRSMDYIINSFQVGKVFFPKQTSTANAFKYFVSVVKNKCLKLTAPSVDSTFKIEEATSKMGTKYHVDGCSSLSKNKIPISLSDAKSKGLTPCSKCNPPQWD